MFALLQLPPELDALSSRMAPQLDTGLALLLSFAAVYAQLAVWALIVAFLAHLALRAYWVALVGLNSVFPQGLRWNNLFMGPHTREEFRARWVELPELIERTDNRSSLVFGLGVILAVMTVILGLFSGLLGGVAILLNRLWPLFAVDTTIFIVLAVVLLVPAGLQLLDRMFGHRWPATHPLARATHALSRWSSVLVLARVWQGPLMTFTSNHGRFRGTVAVIAVLYLILFGVLAPGAIRKGSWRADGYSALPSAGGAARIDAVYYRELRTESERFRSLPMIDNLLVDSDFLRLFVPMDARGDGERLAQRCPQVPLEEIVSAREPATPLQRDEETTRRSALIDCLVKLRPVSLDGQALAAPWAFYRDPASGLAGLLAVIPLRGLDAGRHELTVARDADPDDPDGTAREPHHIAFWRSGSD